MKKKMGASVVRSCPLVAARELSASTERNTNPKKLHR